MEREQTSAVEPSKSPPKTAPPNSVAGRGVLFNWDTAIRPGVYERLHYQIMRCSASAGHVRVLHHVCRGRLLQEGIFILSGVPAIVLFSNTARHPASAHTAITHDVRVDSTRERGDGKPLVQTSRTGNETATFKSGDDLQELCVRLR